MPQSVRITHDQTTRLEARSRLLNKVNETLSQEVKAPERQIFLLPVGYSDLSERELFDILTKTPALQHSFETAINTIGILFRNEPPNVDFKVVDISVPEFVRQEPKKVSPSVKNEPKTRIVDVVVPTSFSSMTASDKKWYLATEGKIASDLADEVIAFLDGKPYNTNLSFNFIVEDFVPPVESTVSINPVNENDTIHYTPVAVEIPEELRSLSDPDLYRHLTISLRLTPEVANESIQQLRLNSRKEEASSEVVENRQVSINLPKNISSLRPFEQFIYLQTEKRLDPITANDLIEVLSGKNSANGFEFNITFEDVEIDSSDPVNSYLEIRAEVKEQLARRITSYSKPVKDKVVFTPPVTERKKLTVSLPDGFDSMKPRDQFLYLTAGGMLSEDANELIAYLSGQKVSTEFDII